jgi:hypothetical protein
LPFFFIAMKPSRVVGTDEDGDANRSCAPHPCQ